MFIVFKRPLMGPVNADEVQPQLLCAGFGSAGEERGEAGSRGHPQLSKRAAHPVPGKRWHRGQAPRGPCQTSRSRWTWAPRRTSYLPGPLQSGCPLGRLIPGEGGVVLHLTLLSGGYSAG